MIVNPDEKCFLGMGNIPGGRNRARRYGSGVMLRPASAKLPPASDSDVPGPFSRGRVYH
jgi:hypothetical protein